MKLNFTFIFLFFIILLSINTNDLPKNTKNFLNLYSNTVRQFIKSNIDNSLISIVLSFNPDDYFDESSKKYTLQKINMDKSSHRILWEFDVNDDPIKMAINQKNNLILVVTKNKNLLTISQDGKLISKIKIEHNSDASIKNFEFNQIDHSLYILFINYRTNDRTIIKYNLQGKEEWRHELRKLGSYLLTIVISYKDQLLFLPLEYDSKEYVIYKISFNGELSELKIKKNDESEDLMALNVDSNEKTIVLITKNENENNISKYTYNGILLWSKKIDNGNLDNGKISIKENDSSIILIGNDNTYGYIKKFNSNGTEINSDKFEYRYNGIIEPEFKDPRIDPNLFSISYETEYYSHIMDGNSIIYTGVFRREMQVRSYINYLEEVLIFGYIARREIK